MNYYSEKAIKRAVAIKQYRFLLKLATLAQEKELYSTAMEYRHEAKQLKERYAL